VQARLMTHDCGVHGTVRTCWRQSLVLFPHLRDRRIRPPRTAETASDAELAAILDPEWTQQLRDQYRAARLFNVLRFFCPL
jgi:hypothetical protein